MKINSLVSENQNLVLVEMEITLLPGLPQIQFLGLPDQIIRESVHRIKSALKLQDFEMPRAQQILVNIRPTHLKKSSRGLELAVAAGILWKTGQKALPKNLDTLIVYGELGLEGDVREPEDLPVHFDGYKNFSVLTGKPLGPTEVSFSRRIISCLKDLDRTEEIPRSEGTREAVRPQEFLHYQFPKAQARLLELVALGEHSLLLAGPAGSGKTTLAKALSGLARAPSALDLRHIQKQSRSAVNWRPVVQPHHSSTPLSLIGGGVPLQAGEFSRADRGILILDEFLEFHPKAQEALREPMEEGKIRLSRSHHVAEFAAEAQVIACTNLCPCGDWVPQRKVHCMRTIRRCKDYLHRLSGPLADRFQILFFTEKYYPGPTVLGSDILQRVERARTWQKSRPRVNARMDRESLLQGMDRFAAQYLVPKEFSSRRRELATFRVARSFADLDLSLQITKKHLEESLDYSWRNFERLKGLD